MSSEAERLLTSSNTRTNTATGLVDKVTCESERRFTISLCGIYFLAGVFS